MTNKAAYEAGFEFGASSRSGREATPPKRGTPERAAWNRGYDDGREARRNAQAECWEGRCWHDTACPG